MYRTRNKKLLHLLIWPGALLASSAIASQGTDVASQMSYYYNRTLDDCGPGRPLDLCSGLRLRGTDSMKGFEPWDPSPNSHKSGGVSMSFLRKDAKYQDLGLLKNNGFVLKPNDFIDPKYPTDKSGEMEINTLCFFPIDAWTDTRNDSGCTDNALTNDRVEQSCQAAGVNTAEAWVKDYRNVKNDHKKQCGFAIRDRTDDAQAFWQGMRAREMIKNDSDAIKTQTEIRVPAWDDGDDKKLPILAFIYTPRTKTSKEGLDKAQDDQRRYFEKTGKWVPVIRVDLPKTNNEDARFTYNKGDQSSKVSPPAVANDCERYIESATWVQRDDPYLKGKPWTLSITPTACGKKMTKEQQHAAYAELFSKYGNDPRWSPDNGSMYRQFVCHQEWSGEVDGKKVYARDKPAWNLEPARPFAEWSEVFKQGCNNY